MANITSMLRTALAVATLALLATRVATASEKLLFNFNGSSGNAPYGALIADSAGNLYDTTGGGGVYGFGTVFELTPKPKGTWSEKILHSFNADGVDGIAPYTQLVFDSAGNLYGTTNNGGSNNVGTVFELSPDKSGAWTETILYSFQDNEVDGTYPYGNLIFDSSGNLYGTTAEGGTSFNGTVYELSRKNGVWTESILHNFGYSDGINPYAGVIFDASGNLYGATLAGGTYGFGTVFEMTPEGSGKWSESVLFNFNGQNATGDGPYATPIFDKAGNLYGTTIDGGSYDCGMVYELTPHAGEEWTETIIHSFEPSDWDGARSATKRSATSIARTTSRSSLTMR